MTATFYFDLASPDAYLAAERVLGELPGPVAWTPVLASGLENGPATGGGAVSHERIAERARELGLQELRWPEPFPFDSSLAMRVATYARQIGRVVPFAQAAFRQAFAGGRSLADEDSVLIAAAACEMHPAAVLAGAATRSVTAELEGATARAREAGVRCVPAVLVPGADEGDAAEVFHGECSLTRAAVHMGGGMRGRS
ncbi:MAG TPA: DsbA family protein [Solirubrobacteraceae bacterium]|nr:DsbA family protein [Solirubrobacteraceae bacterium]